MQTRDPDRSPYTAEYLSNFLRALRAFMPSRRDHPKRAGRYPPAATRRYGVHGGAWGIPAGHAETDERPIEALVRGAREEVGISTDPDTVRLVHTHADVRRGDRSRGHPLFRGKRFRARTDECRTEKRSEIGFFPPHALPDGMVPRIRAALAAIAADEAFSDSTIG